MHIVNKGKKEEKMILHVNDVTCNVPLCINITSPLIVLCFSLESRCSVNVVQCFVNIVCILLWQLSEEGPCEDISSDGQSSSFNEWILPAKEFDGMWERFLLLCSLWLTLNYSFLDKILINLPCTIYHCFCSLIYESGLKQRLLRYAASALLFTEKAVDPFLVSWNRWVLEICIYFCICLICCDHNLLIWLYVPEKYRFFTYIMHLYKMIVEHEWAWVTWDDLPMSISWYF